MKIRQAIGGVVLVLSGLQYLAAEAIAASAWTSPVYSYASNYISDLGVAECPTEYGGRAICSPLSDVMNTGFALEGVLFVMAAVLLAGITRGAVRWVYLLFAIVHGAGIVTVAVVPENAGSPLHVAGATAAIVGGNIAVLAAAFLVRGGPRAILLLLGSVGIASAVLLETTAILPDGVLERGGVYSITAFQIVAGVLALAGRFPLRRVAEK